MTGQALSGRGVAGPRGVAQFLGAAAQLAEIGALGKRVRHGGTLLAPTTIIRPDAR
jgi:hypothetical protein